MNVSTITMPRAEARERLRAYRRSLHRRADAEYQAAADGYAALAEGRTLINIDQAIQEGGFFEDMRPKLAIARADRRVVRFEWRADREDAEFCCCKDPWTAGSIRS